jgi:hypothetical protein
MELHSNQIRWEAPEPHKFNFDKPDYAPLANALGYLSGVAEDVQHSMEAYQDNQLVKNLEKANKDMEEAINNENSLNANYDRVADNAIANWQNIFNSADEATRVRFLRSNPHAQEMFEMSVRAKVLKKRQEQIYSNSKLDIAQMSTSVVTAPKEMQDAVLREKRAEIQNLNLPIEMTNDLLFRLQSEVDDYQIADAIANGYYERADWLLKNALPTKGAADRASLYQQLQAKIKSDSYDKAVEQKLLEEAKEQGKDADSAAILRLHQQMLVDGNREFADRLRLNYYYGKDIPIYDKDGRIERVVHSSETAPELRDKMFAKMETSAKRTPYNEEMQAQYLADFNRLKSGLMKPDGSLDLDEDEYVSPEQYALARNLRNQNYAWRALEKDERTFVDNVLRSYGTEDGLYMIDLNPNTKLKATNLMGLDYQKANPVANYQALLQLYSTPAGAISAAVSGEYQVTGREMDTVGFFAEKYIDEKFHDEYKMERGTRPHALATLFTLFATNNNPNGMKDVGLGMVPRENFEDSMVRYLPQIKQNGLYDTNTEYQTLVEDFKNVYKMTTGLDYMPPKDGDPLQKYVLLTQQYETKVKKIPNNRLIYADKLPTDSDWLQKVAGQEQPLRSSFVNEYEESLYKTGREAALNRDRQRAVRLEKEQVSTFEAPAVVVKKEETKKKAQDEALRKSQTRFRAALMGASFIGDTEL